jgi:hypothetical protein
MSKSIYIFLKKDNDVNRQTDAWPVRLSDDSVALKSAW